MPASRDRTLWPVTVMLTEEQRRWLLERSTAMKGYSSVIRDLVEQERFKNP